jgi:XapX domain-containing protein
MKLALGLIVAVCLGIFCRFFGIPLPGPPAILGAVMAIAMASGYTATDAILNRRDARPPTSPATLAEASSHAHTKSESAMQLTGGAGTNIIPDALTPFDGEGRHAGESANDESAAIK